MTPPDGRDVAEAAVDLEGRLYVLTARVSKHSPTTTVTSAMGGVRFAANEDEARGSFLRSIGAAKPGFAVDELLCNPVADDVVRQAYGSLPAASPTPATAGEPSTAEEVLGEGPAFWLNVKREPAGELGPSLREAYARIIDPGAWALHEQLMKVNPASRTAGEYVADSLAKADTILALRTAPASSVEGGTEWEKVGPELVKALKHADTYFSNRSSSLCITMRATADRVRQALALAPHQPEGGE